MQITLTSKKQAFENRWIKVVEEEFLINEEPGYYGIVEAGTVAITVPVDRDDRIMLIDVFRYPTNTRGWELPMGRVDPNEKELDAARRELVEETTMEANTLTKIGEFVPAPGVMRARAVVYHARFESFPDPTTIELDTDDQILAHAIFTLDQIKDLITNGAITDGPTLSALMMYENNLPD